MTTAATLHALKTETDGAGPTLLRDSRAGHLWKKYHLAKNSLVSAWKDFHYFSELYEIRLWVVEDTNDANPSRLLFPHRIFRPFAIFRFYDCVQLYCCTFCTVLPYSTLRSNQKK